MLQHELDKPARPPVAEGIAAIARNGNLGHNRTPGHRTGRVWHAQNTINVEAATADNATAVGQIKAATV